MSPSNIEQARTIHDEVLKKMKSLKNERRSGLYGNASKISVRNPDGRLSIQQRPIKLVIQFDALRKQVLSWRFELTLKNEIAFASWDGKKFQVSKNFSTICNTWADPPYLMSKAINLLRHVEYEGKN